MGVGVEGGESGTPARDRQPRRDWGIWIGVLGAVAVLAAAGLTAWQSLRTGQDQIRADLSAREQEEAADTRERSRRERLDAYISYHDAAYASLDLCYQGSDLLSSKVDADEFFDSLTRAVDSVKNASSKALLVGSAASAKRIEHINETLFDLCEDGGTMISTTSCEVEAGQKVEDVCKIPDLNGHAWPMDLEEKHAIERLLRSFLENARAEFE